MRCATRAPRVASSGGSADAPSKLQPPPRRLGLFGRSIAPEGCKAIKAWAGGSPRARGRIRGTRQGGPGPLFLRAPVRARIAVALRAEREQLGLHAVRRRILAGRRCRRRIRRASRRRGVSPGRHRRSVHLVLVDARVSPGERAQPLDWGSCWGCAVRQVGKVGAPGRSSALAAARTAVATGSPRRTIVQAVQPRAGRGRRQLDNYLSRQLSVK